MRQRRTVLATEAELPVARGPLSKRIAQVDFFPKPREDYQRQQTGGGAVLSVLTVATVALLVLWEGIAYLRGRDAYDTDVSLDKGLSDKMPVHFDLLFPWLPCNRLSIDVVDATGMAKFNFTGTIHKLPMTFDGKVLYKGSLKDLDNEADPNEAGNVKRCRLCPASALGKRAKENPITEEQKCCNTCESVLARYKEMGKEAPGIEYIPQCLYELYEEAKGCNVIGSLNLKKVPVTVIFGPLRTGSAYAVKDVLQLDTSHAIRKLRIGDESVLRFSEHGVSEPLSGHKSLSETYSETRYLVKVVPTTYRRTKSRDVKASTYEYSAQWTRRSIAVGFSGAVPAVIFGFEPAAIQVNNVFERQPVSHFLVKLCGIVGGLFVVLGFIDRAVEWCIAFNRQRC